MTDYKHVFDEGLRVASEVDYKSKLSTFHDHKELFHFIIAPESQQGTDTEAIESAYETDPTLTWKLLEKGPSLVGHGSSEIDGVESRHIVTLVYLLHNLGHDLGNVVEIGGGYGNYLRLVQGIANYTSWSIVDLPYILELQDWFHLQFGIDDVDYIASDTPYWHERLQPDLVIGIHSLSEFNIVDFEAYYKTIISRSKYFFYVSQTSNPSIQVLERKLNTITKDFDLRCQQTYEHGASIMYLFDKRE